MCTAYLLCLLASLTTLITITRPREAPTMTEPEPQPLYRRDADTIRLIADLRYAARTAAVLLRSAADSAETGRPIDPDTLRGAARDLADIADRD